MAATTIVLEISEEEISFNMTPEAYNKYINELGPDNKVVPCKNFCKRTVDEKDEEKLKELLKKPGVALQLAGILVQEYSPNLGVMVKKPKTAAKK